MMKLLAAVALFSSALIGFCSAGVCNHIDVTNAAYNSINGHYYLTNILCDYNFMWMQADVSVPNYIFYSNAIVDPATGFVTTGWVVSPYSCAITLVHAKEIGYYYVPYDVPEGKWYEFNPSNNQFQINSQLHIHCNSGLSTGAIVGIVFGSVFGAILLVTLIAGLCLWMNKKEPKTPAKAVVTTEGSVPNQQTFTTVAYYPSPGVDPGYVAQPVAPSYNAMQPNQPHAHSTGV